MRTSRIRRKLRDSVLNGCIIVVYKPKSSSLQYNSYSIATVEANIVYHDPSSQEIAKIVMMECNDSSRDTKHMWTNSYLLATFASYQTTPQTQLGSKRIDGENFRMLIHIPRWQRYSSIWYSALHSFWNHKSRGQVKRKYKKKIGKEKCWWESIHLKQQQSIYTSDDI